MADTSEETVETAVAEEREAVDEAVEEEEVEVEEEEEVVVVVAEEELEELDIYVERSRSKNTRPPAVEGIPTWRIYSTTPMRNARP